MISSVWVIVLNWKRPKETIACLESLKGVRDPGIRIVVVDNGSGDDSVAQLEAFVKRASAPSFTLLETGSNLGFAGGMNAGMQTALEQGAEWLLVLNNDTVVDPSFLKTLLEAAKHDPKIGMLNPKILMQEHPDRIWSAGGRINWMRTQGTHIGYDEPDRGQYDHPPIQDSEYVTGGCLLIRREVIEQIGFLPEAYFVYYEDGEWSTKAQRAGWRTVVVPGARIWHKGAASSGEHSASYIRYHVRNGLLFARRTGNPLQVSVAYLWSVPRAVWQVAKLLFMPKRRSWARAILLGLRDAWVGRTGFITQSY